MVEKIAFLYLFAPWFIFLAGWLQISWALVSGSVLAVGLFLALRTPPSESNLPKISLDKKSVIFILTVAFLWTALSGVGGLGLRNWDWFKHNAIFKDLIYQSWPVIFPGAGMEMQALVYYLAYYLPAALAGKLFGWTFANVALFSTTYVGVVLTLFLFRKLVGSMPWWGVILFILFGGLDFFGDFILNGHVPDGITHVEWWAGIWEFPSHTAQLFWAPQHSLIGWLATGLIATESLRSRNLRNMGLIFSCSLLWSPFTALGLAPFLVVSCYRNQLKTLLSFQNLVTAPILMAIAFSFYLSRDKGLPADWVLNSSSLLRLWPRYFLFCAVEFGLYLFFLGQTSLEKNEKGIWLAAAGLSLFLIPFYRLGMFNDFAMRTCIPALFLLSVFISRDLFNGEVVSGKKKILWALVMLGAFPGLFEISRSISWYTSKVPKLQQTPGLTRSAALIGTNQYSGSVNSFFFKKLARASSLSQNTSANLMAGEFQQAMIVVEAERYSNKTRMDYVSVLPSAHGGAIVNNEFGSSVDDKILVSFDVKEPLVGRMLVALYSTAMEGAILDLSLNGVPFHKLHCRNTGSWDNFEPVILKLGNLAAGSHELGATSNGINVNIDAFFILPAQNTPLFIEAEDYENKPRADFHQKSDRTFGGGLVNNGFGSTVGDAVEYSFVNDVFQGESTLAILYATEEKKSSLRVFVDGVFIDNVACPKTRHWWDVSSVSVLIPVLSKGPHKLKVESIGSNINLDAFVFQPFVSSGLKIQAEAYTNETREDFSQKCFWADGVRFIGGDFGASLQDVLHYEFDIGEEIKQPEMIIKYSLRAPQAFLNFKIDDNIPVKLSLSETGDEWKFEPLRVSLAGLKPGRHYLSIISAGDFVGLDSFLIKGKKE